MNECWAAVTQVSANTPEMTSMLVFAKRGSIKIKNKKIQLDLVFLGKRYLDIF